MMIIFMNKKIIFVFSFFIYLLFVNEVFSQTSYTWNGNTSTDWATASNWTPAAVPTSSDNVSIVSATNNPILDASRGVNDFSISSGTLDLNGNTLIVNGTGNTTGGTVNNGTISFTGSSATFASTIFGAVVNVNCSDVYFNGSTFNNTLTSVKTGSAHNSSGGSNTFSGTTTITDAGSGNLYFTTDLFNGNVTFNNTSTSNIYLSYYYGSTYHGTATFNNSGSGNIYTEFNVNGSDTFGDTFNNDVTFTNTGTGIIYPSNGFNGGSTAFNGNIILNCTNGGGIKFGGDYDLGQF